MILQKLLSLNDDETISPTEAQLLNEELSKMSAKDISPHNKAQVYDYLGVALNLNSVKQELIPALDLLYAELQCPG